MEEMPEVQGCSTSAPGPPCGQQLGWTLQHRPHSGAGLGLSPSGAEAPGADAKAALAAMLPSPSISASSALDSSTLHSL